MFSKRTEHDQTPNELWRSIREAKESGRVRADLTRSNPTELGLGFDDDAIRAATKGKRLDVYEPDPRGSEESRAAFGAYLDLPAEDVLLTASTSEAYSFVFATLADPGDFILVPRPSYPLLEWLAKLSGVELLVYDTRYDGEWYVDRESLRVVDTSRARAIVVVSPNNPTGAYLSADDREFLASFGLPLIVDEVFAEYPIELEEKPTWTPSRDGLVFRLTGLSKLAALPQTKLGCIGIVGEEALFSEAKARLELVADTFLSVSSAADLGAPSLLAQSAAVRERIRARCKTNLATLDEALRGSAASRLRVEAGFCVIVRMPALSSEDEFVLALLERGVVVQPGWFYDLSSGPFLVLSLLGDEREFEYGAKCLAQIAAQG